jgi:DNA-binding response OmpR family regulator
MSKVILLVEDYEPLFRAINEKVKRNGIECLEARSVADAQELLETHPEIDLVWLDHILLGEQTGMDFLKSIRENPKFAKLPVIVVSNETNLERKEEYLKLGVAKYYVKVESTLTEIIDDVLKLL